MSEEHIGTIVHYSPKTGAARIELDARELRVGDVVRIRGPHHDFVQEIESIEIDNAAREEGHRGERVAFAVMEPVHERDQVFRISRAPA